MERMEEVPVTPFTPSDNWGKYVGSTQTLHYLDV